MSEFSSGFRNLRRKGGEREREESPIGKTSTHLSESSHQAGLAHTGVPHEHDLEEKLVVLHVREPLSGTRRRRSALANLPLNKDGASERDTGGPSNTNRGTADFPQTFTSTAGRANVTHARTHTDGRTAAPRALTSRPRKGKRNGDERRGAERNRLRLPRHRRRVHRCTRDPHSALASPSDAIDDIIVGYVYRPPLEEP